MIVVPGRGETPATYGRFGARLGADAYRVQVLSAPRLDLGDTEAVLDALAAQLSAAVAELGPGDGLVRPLVVVGADTGAAAVAALASRDQVAEPWWPDALVLAGLPGYAASRAATWEAELDERTACPVHRSLLSEDPDRDGGALAAAVPHALLDAAYGGTTGLPALVLVGDADPLADRPAIGRAVASLPRARLSVVRGAHHDVLNDVQHRSVAAEVVTFLEALRNELVPLVTVESSAW